MNSTAHYFDPRDDGDSPMLSPLSHGMMNNGILEDASYYSLAGPAGPAPFAMTPEVYSAMAPRAPMVHRDSGFGLEFLPTGESMPAPYPGGSVNPSQVLYRDSSEELLSGDNSAGVEENYNFLPSPPEAGDYNAARRNSSITSEMDDGPFAGRPSRRVEKKKRRQASNPSVDSHSKSQRMDSDAEKPRANQRPTTQLRTASRAPKKLSVVSTRGLSESAEEVKARAAHNQVEQQYRKRLNAQFERLLAVLPQPDLDEEGAEGEEGGGRCVEGSGSGRAGVEKRISKAEVLDLARRRIKTLEKERSTLERQNNELTGNICRLQDEWTRRLGGAIPIKTE